jgi:tape measure domain-containing protein
MIDCMSVIAFFIGGVLRMAETTVGSLAYKLKLDSQEFKKGVVATRAEMAAAKRITEELKQPLDRLAIATANLDQLEKKGLITKTQKAIVEKELEARYITEEAAIRKLEKAERDRVNRTKGLAVQAQDQARKKQEESETAAARKGLQDRLAIYKQEKRAKLRMQEEEAAAARKALQEKIARQKQEANELHRLNRERGLSVQAKQKQEEAETAAARKGLQDRLAIYKQEKRAKLESFANQSPMMGPSFQGSNTFASSANVPKAGGMGGGFGFGMKAMGGAMLVKGLADAGAATRQFISDSQKVFTENERTAASFEVFTGSAAKTKMLMQEMKQLAAISGVSFSSISGGAAAMMSYGTSTEEASKKLTQFATMARGDSERFKMMALAFGQVTAAGRLMGQENLQLINAGFNPLAEISRTTGRNMADLKKEMEDGKISVDMVSKAFESATSEGGRFAGMLEKIGETTAGAQSKSSAAWDQAKNDVGEAMSPITKWMAESSALLAKDVSELAGLFKNNAPVAADPPVDPKEEARKRAAEARDRERKALEEQAKTEAERQKNNKEVGMKEAGNMEFNLQRDSLGDGEEKRLDRVLSLMDEVTAAQAKIDFATYGNVDQLTAYLDDAVKKEYERLNIMEQQNEQREAEKRKEKELLALTNEVGDIKRRHLGFSEQELDFATQIGKMQMMMDQGLMDQQTFDMERDRMAKSAAPKMQTGPVASISAGSQEAYKQMIAGQTRGDDKVLKEQQAQKLIMKTQLEANREQVRLTKELVDKMNFEAVGS